MLPELDRLSGVPLTEQISNSIGTLIASNRLRDGARLWSIRKCATTLNVSTTTVSTAYDRLVATGMVQACATKGYFVTGPRTPPARRSAATVTGVTGVIGVTGARPSTNTISVRSAGAGHRIETGAQNLPADWYSDKQSMAILRKWLRDTHQGTGAGPAESDHALCELICTQLAVDNVHLPPSDMLLAGSHDEALDLICSSTLREGDSVVVEDPCSARLLGFLRKRGVTAIGVPRSATGIDTDALEAICRVRPPRLVFAQTAVHDPTGWGSTPASMHALLSLADRYDFMIAEDDSYGELCQAGQVRLVQLANLRRVLYYKSFSSYMWPVREITFITGDRARMRSLRSMQDGGMQQRDGDVERLLTELLRTGRYSKQMARIKDRLRIVKANAARFLADAGLELDGIGGGVHLWARVPDAVDTRALLIDARANRIALADDSAFRLRQKSCVTRSRHLRFNVALSDDIRLYHYLRQALPRYSGSPLPQ
jgi:DNA-binding transcriptional MocR family regulator